MVVAVVATYEFFRGLQRGGYFPMWRTGWTAAILLPLAAYTDPALSLQLPLVAALLAGTLLIIMRRRDFQGALAGWALSVAGSLYVALLLSFFVALRLRTLGLQWLLVAFVCTWACDSAAYLFGKAFGRRPFAPRISPHKTWAGAIGGVLAGALAGLLAVPLLSWPWAWALGLGFVLAVAGVAGDLAESFIKRQLGLKDFSSLIPGHGGMLDRLDSLLFTVPLAYYVAQWLPVP